MISDLLDDSVSAESDSQSTDTDDSESASISSASSDTGSSSTSSGSGASLSISHSGHGSSDSEDLDIEAELFERWDAQMRAMMRKILTTRVLEPSPPVEKSSQLTLYLASFRHEDPPHRF